MALAITRPDIVRLIAYALGHPYEDVILVAAQALEVDATPIVDLPWDILAENTPGAITMAKTFEGLCAYGHGNVVTHLLRQHPHSRARSAAAEAFGRLPDVQFLPVLTEALRDHRCQRQSQRKNGS